MAKCAECSRRFRIRGKTITWQTPDYIQVTHPKHKTDGFLFCSKDCFFRFYARGLIAAIVTQAEGNVQWQTQ